MKSSSDPVSSLFRQKPELVTAFVEEIVSPQAMSKSAGIDFRRAEVLVQYM
jgi:hypothetical protein